MHIFLPAVILRLEKFNHATKGFDFPFFYGIIKNCTKKNIKSFLRWVLWVYSITTVETPVKEPSKDLEGQNLRKEN